MDIKKLIRKNILNLKPYSCARTEFKGEASVFLDANENPYENGYNRYPDPFQTEVKRKLSKVKGVYENQIFIGNGSDEAIDLLYRIFCDPRIDNVIAPTPTYGMYQVCAEINDVEYRQINLNRDFTLNSEAILNAIDNNTKIIFICSPNNPTGNLLDITEILNILNNFNGIVVIDEAYIDFAEQDSMLKSLSCYPNMVILQTFSKAWAQASVRVGMAFASTEIIAYFNKVKYPYNINILAQKHIMEILDNEADMIRQVALLKEERKNLENELKNIPGVLNIYPSDANFILIKTNDANKTYDELVKKGIVVRNRNSITLCQGCLRITVGTPDENIITINAIKEVL